MLPIFFLVATTIPNDEGIPRKLPPEQKDQPIFEFKERNVLKVFINTNDELMVNNQVLSLRSLREKLKVFIDNNGSGQCTYCNGSKSPDFSEKPQLAVISLKADREASYKFYVAVQNEMTAAYTELRETYAENIYGKKLVSLKKEEIEKVNDAYPMLISEAEINKY